MYEVRLLTAALGYPYKIPSAPITRSIRMLFKDKIAIEPHLEKRKFTQPKRSAEPVKTSLSESEKIILKLVNKGRAVTGVTAAAATKWTRNHCSMILTALYKKGLVRRHKAKGNHTRWYVYTKKEGV